MKVKFISKKERQALKLQAESAANQRPEDQPQTAPRKTVSSAVTSKPAPINHLSNEKEGVMRLERSRDHGELLSTFSKELDQERDISKRRHLGLLREAPSSRQRTKDKSALKFEWDKSDDTSNAGIMNFVTKVEQKREDVLAVETVRTWKSKAHSEMTDRDWRIFREDNEIFIKGGKVPNPFRDWRDVPQLHPTLLKNFQRLNFKSPKPIQMQAIPIGLQQRDLLAVAPTGQGKTLAYLIPMITFALKHERVNGNNSQLGPYGIVIVPSRELAEQIHGEFQKITKGLEITGAMLVGGKQIELQTLQIMKGLDIVIGTPGRIKQLLDNYQLSLSRCSWVVIDEADKIITENLIVEVEFILEQIGGHSVLAAGSGRSKVMHLFSATMILQVQKLARSYMAPHSLYITVGELGGGKKQIEQYVELLHEEAKSDRLVKILRGLAGPIMIFVNTREKCENIIKIIERRSDKTACDYHAGKLQEVREKTVAMFKAGKFDIMVATDLGARGLDVKGVTAVISFDSPKNISEFIHRSGRTGRAGMKGKAYTFLTVADESIFYDVRLFLERSGFKVAENLANHPSAQVRPGTVLQVPRSKQIVYTN